MEEIDRILYFLLSVKRVLKSLNVNSTMLPKTPSFIWRRSRSEDQIVPVIEEHRR